MGIAKYIDFNYKKYNTVFNILLYRWELQNI